MVVVFKSFKELDNVSFIKNEFDTLVLTGAFQKDFTLKIISSFFNKKYSKMNVLILKREEKLSFEAQSNILKKLLNLPSLQNVLSLSLSSSILLHSLPFVNKSLKIFFFVPFFGFSSLRKVLKAFLLVLKKYKVSYFFGKDIDSLQEYMSNSFSKKQMRELRRVLKNHVVHVFAVKNDFLINPSFQKSFFKNVGVKVNLIMPSNFFSKWIIVHGQRTNLKEILSCVNSFL